MTGAVKSINNLHLCIIQKFRLFSVLARLLLEQPFEYLPALPLWLQHTRFSLFQDFEEFRRFDYRYSPKRM
jgi:hypothetical protein